MLHQWESRTYMEEVSQPKRHAPIQQGIILLFCQLFGDEKLLVHTRAGSAGQLTVSTLKLVSIRCYKAFSSVCLSVCLRRLDQQP